MEWRGEIYIETQSEAYESGTLEGTAPAYEDTTVEDMEILRVVADAGVPDCWPMAAVWMKAALSHYPSN